MEFAEFFKQVTGKAALPYQEDYAADPFRPTLICVATGLGKTYAAVVPWLHQVAEKREGVPTRLFLVLPRQNLTEQTSRVIAKAVEKAGLAADVRVIELMGASRDNRATLRPDERAIVVCTQDMYLSRALNRGYARRPVRWPIDFALFNQDALLVFDEVQLMSDGLATTTQLAAFRERYGVFGNTPCVWMSATLRPEWLDTVDFRGMRGGLRSITLTERDRQCDIVRERIEAKKSVKQAPETCRTPQGCADFVLAKHRAGELTLVVTNTVARAREIAWAVRKQRDVILLHSRFRLGDRRRLVDRLTEEMPEAGQIVVATQVLEAGIDISAERMVTDAAPWGSMVQRFGRVNRGGLLGASAIWWVDQPLRGKTKADDKDLYLPYPAAQVEAAIEKLRTLVSGAPKDLPAEDGPAPWRNVLRKADLLDLFDTTPDLAGNAVDVSRFIRSSEEKDCYVAWRLWDEKLPKPPREASAELEARELCPVPIGELKKWAEARPLFIWDFANKGWEPVANRESIFPGVLVLANSGSGGYTEEEGWSPESKREVPAPGDAGGAGEADLPEADEDDPRTWLSDRQTLEQHTTRVVEEMERLLLRCGDLEIENFHEELRTAARKHDWGKAHPVMQATLRRQEGEELLAKQKREGNPTHGRKHFRHELGSALAMLDAGDPDLSAYLAAAHHGRIRVSIRSMPGELTPEYTRIRGIQDGDILPEANLGGGVKTATVRLTLWAAPMGSGANGELSWVARTSRLRDTIGPFRLAFLEMLLRAADELASEPEKVRQEEL